MLIHRLLPNVAMKTPITALFSVFLCFVLSQSLFAQEGYRLPPQEIVDIIDAKPPPRVSMSPDANWILLTELDAMPDITDMGRRMLRLAGVRIDPVANSRFSTSFGTGLLIRRTDVAADNSDAVRIPIPAGEKVGFSSWAHDNSGLAFTTITEKGSKLYWVDPENPSDLRLLHDNISTILDGVEWTADAKSVVVLTVPRDRGQEPQPALAPFGPNIQESSGKVSPTRTYQDLLSNKYDEDLFEFYTTTRLSVLPVDGSTPNYFASAIYTGIWPSPDGEHILVTTIEKPFSYLMTYRSFPQKVRVMDRIGNTEHLVADIPMAENIPIGGVRTGRRSINWMSSKPATLAWFEALDGGDPKKEVDFRDRVMQQSFPFEGEPQELAKVEHRASRISYMEDANSYIVTEIDRDRRWLRSKLYTASLPEGTVLEDRSYQDNYADPGSIVQISNENGQTIALQHGDTIYRRGRGANPKGDLPFLDSQNLKTMETSRLWQCKEGSYETVIKVINDDRFVTSMESPENPPNYIMRSLGGMDSFPLTMNEDPTPSIRGISKRLVKYKRKDGVDLSATLYLPADYKEGEKLPLIVWAYPREYSNAKTAGQISGSPSRFTRMRGTTHLAMLTQGYAIMNNATMPVIGDAETMNDTFIEQITDAAQAAIDHAVELGVADRNRVGVGGHSYGAFMTANLLAHNDLFKTGIARSGAYNRTLTPFGFQSERRSYWNAKEVYHGISPFMHANKINEPILLIHGEKDNNSGTFPLQSKRLYQAVKGNGGTVRLVMLPHESHGYRARQSVLHTQAEMLEWMDKHVKNAKEVMEERPKPVEMD